MLDKRFGDGLGRIVLKTCKTMLRVTSMSISPYKIGFDQTPIEVRSNRIISHRIGKEVSRTKSTEWIVNGVF